LKNCGSNNKEHGVTKPVVQPDPMDHLADALVEDILATPPEVLLAESAEDYGDPRALATEFDRIVTSNASPMGALKVGSTLSVPHVPAGGVSQRAADHPSRWRVGFERLWQTLLPAGGERLTPWGAPLAAVCLLALVALSVMAALHWERRGSSEEFMHGLTPASTPAAEPSDGPSRRGVEYLVLLPEQPSLEAALASYRNLQRRLPALLAGRDPVIRTGAAGDHAYVAGIGPFTKADEAKDFCSELKRTGAACHVGEADR
jgi:hypothetical protein